MLTFKAEVIYNGITVDTMNFENPSFDTIDKVEIDHLHKNIECLLRNFALLKASLPKKLQ